MKKNLLLLAVLFMSAIAVNATDWQQIDTNMLDLSLNIDKDSIKQINPQEYFYTIKFQNQNNPEKVVFIKSNIKNDYMGIISVKDYNEKTYNPKAVYADAHPFMKPVKRESFLYFAQSYITNTNTNTDTEDKTAFTPDEQPSNAPVLRGTNQNVKPIVYKTVKGVNQKETKAANLKEYIQEEASVLNSKWCPPKSGKKTQGIIIVSIGSDGSLSGYKFAKSTGDEATDRSIVRAIQDTVPFNTFPKENSNLKNVNCQFVFSYGKFKKSVI